MSNKVRALARAFLSSLVAVGSIAPVARPAQSEPPTGATAQTQQEKGLVRYVRAGERGARVYNLNDPQAEVLLEVPAETVLAVHAERSGWLDAEAPGGFQVWVWGEFLAPTNEFGVFQVTGSDVRMRPLPSSGIESYPLEQRLSRGQKLRMIERKDETLPLARDWVRLWSPPGARAWIQASETVPLAADQNGAALWGAAATLALEGRKTPKASAATTSGGAQDAALAPAQQVAAALREADELFAAERAKDQKNGTPDYAAVLAGYQAVLELEPKGPTADIAVSRMSTVSALSEAYSLRKDLIAEREDRQRKLQAARQGMAEAGTRDAFYGRFEERGRLVRRTLPGQDEPIWVLSWGGGDVAELVCFSGRYDLGVFAEFEVGINGRRLRGPIEATADRPGRPAQVDVARLEVLSGRGVK